MKISMQSTYIYIPTSKRSYPTEGWQILINCASDCRETQHAQQINHYIFKAELSAKLKKKQLKNIPVKFS